MCTILSQARVCAFRMSAAVKAPDERSRAPSGAGGSGPPLPPRRLLRAASTALGPASPPASSAAQGPAPHLKPGSAPRPLRARGPAAPQTPRCPPAARVLQVFPVCLPWWRAQTRETRRVRGPRDPPLGPGQAESWEL